MLRTGLSCILALVTVGTGPLQAQPKKPAQKTYVVNFETMGTDGTPWSTMFKRFARLVTKRSGGRLKVKAKFGTAAGESSIVKRCIDGQLQACGVTVGALSTRVKDLAVLELPYLFLDFKEVDTILNGPALPHVKKILARNRLVFYCWSENGWRSFGTKEDPIRKPGDLEGLKMRAMENPLHVAMYRALKAKPVPLNLPDVVKALEKGDVVGFDQSPMYLTAASWHKHIKFYTLTRHIFQPVLAVFNKRFFNGLPRDLQQVILGTQAEVEAFGRKKIREIYKPLVNNLKSEGIKVIELTPAQRVPFVIATKKAHLMVYKGLSPRARKLLDVIYKAKQRK
jgi:TRAP-type C4-dicarboxylate transport system substrate-binding protein